MITSPHFGQITLKKSVAIMAWMAISGLLANAAAPMSRPNILVILSDDQGMNDVGCYGSEIPTPNLDRLAREGLRFTQFYAASSICTPSRFGLLTGRFAHRSIDRLTSALMFLSDDDANRGIRSSEITYASMLKQVGYQTRLVGKWHLGHGDDRFWPTEHGFDTFFGHTGGCVDFFTCRYGNQPDWYRGKELIETSSYATDVITDEALRVIEHTDREQPWCVHLAYNAPHFGKGFDEQTQAPVNVMQPKLADLDKVSFIADPLRRSFAAKVIGMDASIGRVLKALDKTQQADHTLVIFMTDHGGDPKYGGSNEPFRGGKATLFEGGLRVPCIVRWPGMTPANSVTDQVASMLDWFPTFAEISGGKAPTNLDGQSLLPLITSRNEPSPSDHRPIVWMTGSHAELSRKSWRAIRSGRWKLIQAPDQTPMLLDIADDPLESSNLANIHPEIIERLQQDIKATITE
ncbi:MAG: sulfatase-like hydrolase/transferase [Planctomycetota bacterium]